MSLKTMEEIAQRIANYEKRISHLERLEGGGGSFMENEYHPDRPPGGANDDEFQSTIINPAWTIGGALAPGAIDWFEAGAVDKYDLTQMAGKLMLQTDNAGGGLLATNAFLRKPFVPGAGEFSVVCKMHVPMYALAGPTLFGNLFVSDDVVLTNDRHIVAGLRDFSNAPAIFHNAAGSPLVMGADIWQSVLTIYAAIIRDGATIYQFISLDGMNWWNLGTSANITVNYLWIGIEQSAAQTPRPVIIYDWVRTYASATLTVGANP